MKKIKSNCAGKKDCHCGCGDGIKQTLNFFKKSLTYNSNTESYRYETFEGKEYLVVPVIMMRDDVVMNSSRVPADEIIPVGWNGVPVTVDHPKVNGEEVSANDPDVLTEYAVGQIFNARNEDGKLKAEAWIDVFKANVKFPGLLNIILGSENLDVSTGYFSTDLPSEGHMNGRDYDVISVSLIPDHLALLPGEIGACSWEDGCGIRSNRMERKMTKVNKSSTKILDKIKLKANELGMDEDWEKAISELVDNEKSPFTAADLDALGALSKEALDGLKKTYLAEEETPAEELVDANENDTMGEDDTKEVKIPAVNQRRKKSVTLSLNDLGSLIATEVKKALKSNGLSEKDRAALTYAGKIVANHRTKMIEKIVANSKITSDQLSKMDDTALEVIANGLISTTDYSGRISPVINEQTSKDPAVAAMAKSPTINSFLAAKKEKVK